MREMEVRIGEGMPQLYRPVPNGCLNLFELIVFVGGSERIDGVVMNSDILTNRMLSASGVPRELRKPWGLVNHEYSPEYVEDARRNRFIIDPAVCLRLEDFFEIDKKGYQIGIILPPVNPETQLVDEDWKFFLFKTNTDVYPYVQELVRDRELLERLQPPDRLSQFLEFKPEQDMIRMRAKNGQLQAA